MYSGKDYTRLKNLRMHITSHKIENTVAIIIEMEIFQVIAVGSCSVLTLKRTLGSINTRDKKQRNATTISGTLS